MSERFKNPVIKYTTNDLKTLPGSLLYFYETGTTTPKLVYQDVGLTIPHSDPVVSDGAGIFAPIFLDGVYRVELKNSAGVTQSNWPVDNVGEESTGFVHGPNSSTIGALAVFDSTDGTSLANGPVPTNGGISLITAPATGVAGYLRLNGDESLSRLSQSQIKTDLSLPADTVSELALKATIADLALKAPLASPVFTGNPTAPTPDVGDSSDSISTTAYVQTELSSYVKSVSSGDRISVDNTDPQNPIISYAPLASDEDQPMKTPASFFGKKSAYSAIVLLGDSNGEGVGAANYGEGYAGLFFRAVQNAVDGGPNTDRGFRYESILRMNVSGVYGFSSTGTLIGGGVCDSRISLASGQSLFVTGREVATVDCFYESGLSTGSLEFRLNGAATPFKTVAITGTGTKNTFPSYPVETGYYIKETDTVEIRSVGGTVVVTELFAVRSSATGPLCYSIVRQGWGINEFNDPARVTEAAAHINQFATSGDKLVIICLGTNNQSSVVGLQLSPADYITALDDLIDSYRAALTVSSSTTKFAVWVPHETLDPRPLGTYQDYIDAIVEYCDNSVDTQCIRLDKSAVGYNHAYLADNRHFNKFGHAVVARFLCDRFGIPQRFDIPSRVEFKTAPVVNVPSVVGAATPGTQTHTLQYGVFKSRDGECIMTTIVTISATSGASGAVRITNTSLPTAGLDQPQSLQVSGFSGVSLPAGYTQVGAEIINATNTIAIYKSGTGVAKATLNTTEISATFSINISGTYLTQ